MYRSRILSVSIAAPWREVYEFLAEPLNLPTWALAIERIEHRRGNDWAAATPQGEIILRFPARNPHGVLDYAILTADDETGYEVPLRVFPNGEGTEVVFVHYLRPDVSEAQFGSEAEWISADLQTLKTLLESRPVR